MLKRTITGLVMAIIIIPLIYFSGWFYTGLIAILSFLSGYEILNMVEKKEASFRKLKYIAPLWNVLLIVSYPLFSYNLLAPVCVLFAGLITFLSLMIIRPSFKVSNTIILIFNYIYTGVFFFSMLYLRRIELSGYLNQGLYLIGYLLIVVVGSDVGAYLVGKLLGKRKLCPTISPNKTVGGFVGGLVISVSLGIAYYFLVKHFTNISLIIATEHIIIEIIVTVITTIFVSLASTIGDLIASKLKRAYDIKDYGNIFPGHGGVLDRFDSTIVGATMLLLILLLVAI